MQATQADFAGFPEATEPAPGSRAYEVAELEKMGRVMVREGGLLNFQQSAIILDVCVQRVYQLVAAGILKRHTFCDRHYLSFKDVNDRRDAEVKSGRPKSNLVDRVKASLKAAAKTDSVQVKHGGFNGRNYAKERKAK